MSKQQDSKVEEVPGPRKIPDSSVEGFQHPNLVQPRTLKPSQFLQYESLELRRLNQTFSRFKRSIPYLGVSLLLGLALGSYKAGEAKHELYGENKNGGFYINLFSRNSDSDMAYNREFQRNRYLSENPIPDRNYLNSSEHLAQLGIKDINKTRNVQYDKRAPHPKYYY